MEYDLGRPVSRRRFLYLAGGACLALASGCALPTGAKQNGAPETRFLRQLVTRDNRAARTLMWQSAAPQDGVRAEWRAAGQKNAPVLSVPAASVRYTDDGQNVFLHTAHLGGLAPGRSYEYRVARADAVSDWRPLRTDGGGAFTALIFPDSQSSDYSGWQTLAQDAFRRHPDAAFFTNLGDLVDNGEEHSQWDAWLSSLEGVIERVPFAPVMGNHETYDKKWEVRLPAAYLAEFAVPENGSAAFARWYYSFDFGDVHFSVLNTQWDEIDGLQSGLLAEQLAWLPKDIAASTRRWNIVLLHKDVLQYRIRNRPERAEGISGTGEAFMPLFDALPINAVLSAHLHTYRNRGRIRAFRRDPSGPLYLLTGVAGNVRYPGLWLDHALDERVAPQPETANYLTLDASRNALVFRCYLPDGTLIDEVTLRK